MFSTPLMNMGTTTPFVRTLLGSITSNHNNNTLETQSASALFLDLSTTNLAESRMVFVIFSKLHCVDNTINKQLFQYIRREQLCTCSSRTYESNMPLFYSFSDKIPLASWSVRTFLPCFLLPIFMHRRDVFLFSNPPVFHASSVFLFRSAIGRDILSTTCR